MTALFHQNIYLSLESPMEMIYSEDDLFLFDKYRKNVAKNTRISDLFFFNNLFFFGVVV